VVALLRVAGNRGVRDPRPLFATRAGDVVDLSAKLCDVFPDGTSALITRGMLNLTHRHSSVDPEALVPGEAVDVVVELEAASWVFEPGHRIRLALAGTDWPNAWPPPEPVTLHVERSSVVLELPELPPPAVPLPVPVFAVPGPESWHPGEPSEEAQPEMVWRFAHDVLARRTDATVHHGSRFEGEDGARVGELYDGTVSVSTVDPGDATAVATARYEIAWPEATCVAESRLRFRSDAETYHIEIELDVDDGDQPFARRRWQRDIPRHLQ
jgi:uncharacterized protein